MQLVIISTQHKVDEQKNEEPHVLPFYLTGASWTQKDYAEHYGYELYGDEDNVFVSVSSNRAKQKKNTNNAASIKISNRFEALKFSTMSDNFIAEDNEVANGTDDFIVEDNECVNGTADFSVEDVEVENGIQENFAIDILSEIFSTVVERSIPTENLVSDKSHQTRSAKKPKKKKAKQIFTIPSKSFAVQTETISDDLQGSENAKGKIRKNIHVTTPKGGKEKTTRLGQEETIVENCPIRNKYFKRKKLIYNCRYFTTRVCFNKKCNKSNIKLRNEGTTVSIENYIHEIENQIKNIEIDLAAQNTINFMYDNVNSKQHSDTKVTDYNYETLESEISSITGNGRPTKRKNVQKGQRMRTAYTEMCAIDSLMNLIRASGFIKFSEQHERCDHKELCAVCIIRSAICKCELSKAQKGYVELPEIRHNLWIFLGPYYCGLCCMPFETEEDESIHKKTVDKHRYYDALKGLSLKKVFDNFLRNISGIDSIVDKFQLILSCTACEKNINKSDLGYVILSQGKKSLAENFVHTINSMVNNHSQESTECQHESFTYKDLPENLIFLMSPESIETIDEKILLQNSIYHFKGQISFHDGPPSKHFYTRIKKGTKYFKMDELQCTEKDKIGNPKKTMMLIYAKNEDDESMDINDLESKLTSFIYDKKHLQFFRETKKEVKERRAQISREKYKQDAIAREKKKESQKVYEKTKYNEDEDAREKKKESQKVYEKTKYDKDEAFRNRKRELRSLFYHSNRIETIIQKNLLDHNSGMEYICLSCTRLRSREQVGIWKEGKENVDKQLLKLPCTKSFDGKSYICTTCRPALYRGTPKINMMKLNDISFIGSVPYKLPKLNLLEQYLIKLTIPFIRVAHIPRTPNLKLLGGSVCIQSDLSHTVQRLDINPETIIPVSFKRKLQYEGHYIEQVIDKEKVFQWLSYLKRNNHLYRDVQIDVPKLESQIDKFEDKLLTEMVNYDEKRMSKEQAEAKDIQQLEKKHANIQLPEDIFYSDDDDTDNEDGDSEENAIPEIVDEIDVQENDTFLYPVCQLNLEDNTVSNKIAKLIVYGEKCLKKEDEKLSDVDYQVEDEFAPDFENYLFNNRETEESMTNEIDDAVMKEMEQSFDLTNEHNIESNSEKEKQVLSQKVSKEKQNVRSKKKRKKERATVVAPGEGQDFDNEYKYQEEKCFPDLFPMGKGGYTSTYMELGLGFSNYCKLRLTSGLCLKNDDLSKKIIQIEEDSRIDYQRFRGNHHYMMFLLLILDAINMRRAQTTAFRKVTRLHKYNVDTTNITNEDKEHLERRNIGYRTFKSIRGTAPYFELQKSRLFAFLRQIGPPTIFTTITSAEYDWCDLMINIIKAIPDARDIKDIVKTMKARSNLEYLLNLPNEEDIRSHAKDIVINMEGPEMSKLVNDHLVHSIADFDQRIKYLFKLFKLPGNCLYPT